MTKYAITSTGACCGKHKTPKPKESTNKVLAIDYTRVIHVFTIYISNYGLLALYNKKTIEHFSECYGTHVGFGMSGNQDDHYESLRRRYKDCTHVEGNLEITHVDKAINSSYDISFLSSIEIVTGYVLLGLLEVEAIPLINLRLIRADSTYNIMGEEYGLVVALTSEAGDDPKRVGLRELQLSSLKGN